MENKFKYSKEKFEGHTHRFKVRFSEDDDFRNDTCMDIYSNSGSKEKLEDFINEKKLMKVISFKIENRSTKEQDDATSAFLDEFLTTI